MPTASEVQDAEQRLWGPGGEVAFRQRQGRLRSGAARRRAPQIAPAADPRFMRHSSLSSAHPSSPIYRAAWGRYMLDQATDTDMSVLRMRLPTGDEDSTPAELRAVLEQRDLGVGSGSIGGFTVPATAATALARVVKAYSAVIRVAQSWETTSGSDAVLPLVSDDSANSAAITAENSLVASTGADITLTGRTFHSYPYVSKIIKLPWTLLRDTSVPLESRLADVFGARLGRGLNVHLTSGTGAGAQPEGYLTNLTVGPTLPTGNTTTFTYNGVVDLVHSVDPAYRELPGCAFMCNDTSLAALQELKDSSNRPLWVASDTGPNGKLMGFDVVINPTAPNPAANVVGALTFGNWQLGYVVRVVGGTQYIRLAERYADTLEIGVMSYARFDGQPLDAAALRGLKHSAT